MADTLPGELRWDPAEQVWTVRCAVCSVQPWGRRQTPDAEQMAAFLLGSDGRGWRCVAARWHCPGCAR